MKKLRLNLQQMENAEMLTRDQLKNLFGGNEMTVDAPCGTSGYYCGDGSGVRCCLGYTCEPAGNATNPDIPGGDKICEW